MILLLGYLASLLSAFVISAVVLSVTLNVMLAKKAGHHHQAHVAQVSKLEKDRRNSRAARLADAGRLPVVVGKEVEKR